MRLVKTAVKLFLVWAAVFFMASWIHADELSAIKDGYNSYWSNIKDGKGGCTEIRQHFTADNQEVPQYTLEDDYEWMFAGSKIRYSWKHTGKSNSQGSSSVPGADIINEVYFDGQRVTVGSGNNFVLRKPNISDINQTNQWDPRLITTGSGRTGESWEPVPFWQAWNSKIISKEKINGYECYVLEGTIDRNGRQMVRRSWLDIERNYCLVRSEIWFYVGKDTVIPKDLEWTKDAGRYLSSRTDIELKKYGKDLWGPKKYGWTNYVPNPQTKTFYISDKTTKTYDDACAYNLGLTEKDLKIVLPSDAKVSDATKYPTDYVKPKVSIEFRITKNTPEAGFTQTNVPDSNEKVYIPDKAELTDADIKGVKVNFSTPGFPVLDILFTEEGAKKFAEVTQNHLKERMAIFVDGKLLSLPIIHQKIPGGRAQISGRLTEAEIKRIIGDEVVPSSDTDVSGVSKYPTDYVKPRVSIEFRTTSRIPLDGFTQVNTPDTNEKVYVSNKAEITEADISGVKVNVGKDKSLQLELRFTEKGTEKLAELTQNHLNEREAIFVDGKLTNLPVIKEKIPHGTSLTLSGSFTEAEIKRIIGDEVK